MEPNALMPFDEINRFETNLTEYFETNPETGKRNIKSEEAYEDILDEMFDLFMMSCAMGTVKANTDLGTDVSLSVDDVMPLIDRKIEDKTWRDRMRTHFEEGCTEADIMRIVETEAHRDSNGAAYITATKAGATRKVWNCSLLPTSRDSHVWLHMVSAPIGGKFYNYKGESTYYPGQWGIAEEDINCLCWLTYSK